MDPREKLANISKCENEQKEFISIIVTYVNIIY